MSEVVQVTTNQLNDVAEKIADLRIEEARASAAKKVISDQLELAEKEAQDLLVASGLKSYRAPAGTVGITYRTSVKLPKTAEDREKLLAYVREQGLEHLIGINSMSLNSLYKDGLNAAIEAGVSDFAIPGVTEVTVEPNLSFRKDPGYQA